MASGCSIALCAAFPVSGKLAWVSWPTTSGLFCLFNLAMESPAIGVLYNLIQPTEHVQLPIIQYLSRAKHVDPFYTLTKNVHVTFVYVKS